jgi:hypothetical protein
MQDLEFLILTEARRQGVKPNADAVRQAGIDLAGSALTEQGLILMPGKGAISPADFVRSLRNRLPEAFGSIDDKPAGKPAKLTERMRAEIAASRKRPLPSLAAIPAGASPADIGVQSMS